MLDSCDKMKKFTNLTNKLYDLGLSVIKKEFADFEEFENFIESNIINNNSGVHKKILIIDKKGYLYPFFHILNKVIYVKNICLIGGGHGTSRLIKGFKNVDAKVDVIVTSSDNGGHTGDIIKEFDVPALGDLRMVLESVLEKPLVDFFSYRFKCLHGKNNVSLGNLILLSMVLEYGSVNKMISEINEITDKKYTFHLANTEYVELNAIDSNNNIVVGETQIGECETIKSIHLSREGKVEEETLKAIEMADIIVLSFGSFYTSLGAVINSNKIKETIKNAKGKIIYIPNLVNQKETKGYSLENYVDYLEKTLERKLDRVIVSNTKIKRKIIKRYSKENRTIVVNENRRDNYEFYSLTTLEEEKLRHDVNYLGQIIIGENGLK